jgi:hypothetical protein
MSKLLKRREAPSLKLIEVIEDGSSKTFIYEDPNKKGKTGLFARLATKVQRKLKLLTN